MVDVFRDRCNSDKCHCPRCQPAREQAEKTLDALRDALRDRERREAWKRNAARAAIDQAGVCTGQLVCFCPNCVEYRDYWRASSWIWHAGPRGWRRMDKRTRRRFGPIYTSLAKRNQAWRDKVINPFDGQR